MEVSKKTYTGYYRVSTREQGQSGLGLKAQQRIVRKFCQSTGTLVGEFMDVESGKSDDRKGLLDAIDHAAKTGSILVVKDLSRISRGGYKVMMLLEEKDVTYVEAASPYDNQLIKEIKFSLAKEEREKIAERTSSALQEIKEKIARGEEHISKEGNVVTGLGNPQNLTDAARAKGTQSCIEKAKNNENNKRAAVMIKSLRDAGMSYGAIAKSLNDNKFKTANGKKFSSMQVSRLYNRF